MTLADHGRGGVFVDEHIDATGRDFAGAAFDGCVIVRDAAEPDATFSGCVFNRCQFVGDGWPPGFGRTHAVWQTETQLRAANRYA